MRLFVVMLLAATAISGTSPTQAAEKGEARGLAIYSKESAKAVEEGLAKVEGVSRVVCDLDGRSVTFECDGKEVAETQAACHRVIDALHKLGLSGNVSIGKSTSRTISIRGQGEWGNEWLVKDVHVGKEEAQKKVRELLEKNKSFSKVTLEGKGLQQDVRLVGTRVNAGDILAVLLEAGLHGDVKRVLRGEITGLGIYCKESAKAVEDALARVDGISRVTCDLKARRVTFEGKDGNAPRAAREAVHKLGLTGSLTFTDHHYGKDHIGGGQEPKSDEWLVKGVHAGCEEGEKNIRALLEKNKAITKVTFEGKGPQKEVRIMGKDLGQWGIRKALQEGGFHGEAMKAPVK